MTTNKQQKKAAITNLLSPYLNVGILDDLTADQNKELATYYAPVKPADFNDTGDIFQCSPLIVKELDAARIPIYTALSESWNPYLETVFGLIQVDGTTYSLNACVTPPEFLKDTHDGISLSLEEYMEKHNVFSETEALIFLYELCEGLKDLHKKKRFHGDISPQNILLTDAIFPADSRFQEMDGLHQKIAVTIIDFGNAKNNKAKNHPVTAAMGTKPYAAPDILDFQHPVDQRADIYSLGCVLGFMLTGASPKQENIRPKVSKKIWNIIEKCTGTYYERFSNVTQLQRRILKELNYSSTVGESILRSIPGFRSHNYIKMAVACYFYFAFLLGGISMAIANVFPAAIIMPLLFLLSIICIFDVFHLMELVQSHCYFLRKHKKLALVLRLTVAFILIYGASMFLGRYL